MKKIILFTILLIPNFFQACQVIFINNTNNQITVIDLRDGSQRIALAGEQLKANTNPNEHAIIKIITPKTRYNIKQIACSQSHQIPVSWTDLHNGTYDKNLLIVEKE